MTCGWAGCASDETSTTGPGGTGGSVETGGGGHGGTAGAGGTGGAGGTTTTETCIATGTFSVGPAVEVEPATAFGTPKQGASPAVATNGSVHFAVWSQAGRLVGARLSADGTPIDVPPKEIWSQGPSTPPAVVWDGSSFVVVWATLDGTWDLRATHVDPATGEVAAPAVLAAGGVNSSVASHGGVTLIVFNETATDALLGLRLGPGAAVLDAAPFEVGPHDAAGLHPVAWDGSSFVTTWKEPGSEELRAARITPDGDVLDPGGVVVPFPQLPEVSLGLDGASLHAWTEGSGTGLFVMRLSDTLQPLDPAPVGVFNVNNPLFEHLESLSLSRAASGDVAIGWVHATDIDTENMAYVREVTPDLAPVGAALTRFIPASVAAQALTGLLGPDHLAVRAAETLHAERLDGAGAGLSHGVEHAIAFEASTQDWPALVADPNGYLLAFREEDPAGGWLLKAKSLDMEGNPSAEPAVTLEKVQEGTDIALGRAASGALVTRADDTLRVGRITGGGLSPDAVLTADLARSVGIACLADVCVVAWSVWDSPSTFFYAQRVAGDGSLLDAEPVLLATGAIGERGPRVVAGGGQFGVFWYSGAVRMALDGSVVQTPGFALEGPEQGLPIAGAPATFLAADRGIDEDWIHVRDLDGNVLGAHLAAGRLAFPLGAAWDGAAYVFLGKENKAHPIDETATLGEPTAGLDIAYSFGASIASRSPGRLLVAETVPNGRLVVQTLTRSDAATCDP